MKYQLVAGLCFAFILALFAGSNGYNVKYGGGSLPHTQVGTDLNMYIGSNQVRFAERRGPNWSQYRLPELLKSAPRKTLSE